MEHIVYIIEMNYEGPGYLHYGSSDTYICDQGTSKLQCVVKGIKPSFFIIETREDEN